jgi:hypothetical protein
MTVTVLWQMTAGYRIKLFLFDPVQTASDSSRVPQLALQLLLQPSISVV